MLDELSHTNIVKYIDFKFDAIDVDNDGNEEHIAYMVMELAEGGGLIDKIMDEHKSGLDRDHLIWPVLMIEMWAREWLDR